MKISDDDNDLFNLRVLNMHPDSVGAELYMSKSDETFNEAESIEQLAYKRVIRK